MSPIHERRAPPKRLIVRIAVAGVLVLAAYLYALHIGANERTRRDAAAHVLTLVRAGKAPAALADGVAAEQRFGNSPALVRSLWAGLMADGGRHGAQVLLKWRLPYTPHDADFRLMFSTDTRFIAAIDGDTITVWNVESGTKVLTTEAGDRFIGYWRIGASHFGLLASYQYYDLVNAVIALPDGFRYAQPSKNSLSAVAPGGDWAYRVPDYAAGRTDYPIKLVDLHTGEKREVDAGFGGKGLIAVDSDATRIASQREGDSSIGLWDARARSRIAQIAAGPATGLYFSKALNSVVVLRAEGLRFFDADKGERLFDITDAPFAIADDPKGMWFAVQTKDTIRIYRGAYSPYITTIAEREVSRAPATSR